MDAGNPKELDGSSAPKWSWSALRHDLAVGLISGIVVAALSGGVAVHFDDQRSAREARLEDQRSDRETRLENLRFVRDHSSVDPVPRPFQNMDLSDQNLAGLNLEKATFEESIMNKARFKQANLKGAVFSRAKMRGASFYETNAEGADMIGVDLSDAFIFRSNLLGARISSADLRRVVIEGGDFHDASLSFSLLDGATLADVDLSATSLTGVCYTADTRWPGGFRPPPMDEEACQKRRAEFR